MDTQPTDPNATQDPPPPPTPVPIPHEYSTTPDPNAIRVLLTGFGVRPTVGSGLSSRYTTTRLTGTLSYNSHSASTRTTLPGWLCAVCTIP